MSTIPSQINILPGGRPYLPDLPDLPALLAKLDMLGLLAFFFKSFVFKSKISDQKLPKLPW